ncbi:hypothetical protein [Cellvibrio sp. UBA7661]|uniref:hypothetical protein n=1 Tax=Cellvibrio sp. UBA7661 TaxID=1946311 RepID=UPI002F353D50
MEKLEKNLPLLLVVGVIVCISIISFGTLSNKESALLSLLLTILSVIVSWLVSKRYSDSQHAKAILEVKEMHSENLRTYALKAAEKVNNLSLQLNRLSTYLEMELQNVDYEKDSEALSAKEERLESAIHMIAMLKSVNDTSLSDWQGVIGDEIEEQREEQEEREEELRSLVGRLERLWLDNKKDTGVSTEELNQKINSLRKEIKIAVSNISGTPLSTTRPKKIVKRNVEAKCTNCKHINEYVQRARRNSVKHIVCSHCSVTLISRFNPENDNFIVEQAGPKLETITCPNEICSSNIKVMIDTQPHTKSKIVCDSCSSSIHLKRLSSGNVQVSMTPILGDSDLLTDELLQEIKSLLPDQPWPKYIHKSVAKELGLSNGVVQRAIRELIKKGDFKEQIDGKLFELNEIGLS